MLFRMILLSIRCYIIVLFQSYWLIFIIWSSCDSAGKTLIFNARQHWENCSWTQLEVVIIRHKRKWDLSLINQLFIKTNHQISIIIEWFHTDYTFLAPCVFPATGSIHQATYSDRKSNQNALHISPPPLLSLSWINVKEFILRCSKIWYRLAEVDKEPSWCTFHRLTGTELKCLVSVNCALRGWWWIQVIFTSWHLLQQLFGKITSLNVVFWPVYFKIFI